MKYEIEIEGLPEGWELTRLKLPDNCIEKTNSCTISINNQTGAVFSLKKLKPRKIVLEETEEFHEDEDANAEHTQFFPLIPNGVVKVISNKKWRIVEEIKPDSIPQK